MVRRGDTMHFLVDVVTNYSKVWRYNALSGGHVTNYCTVWRYNALSGGHVTNYGSEWRYNVLFGGHGYELWYGVAIQCIVWWTWVRTMVRCVDTMHCLVDMGTNYGTLWRYNALFGGHGYELWYGVAIQCIVWWSWVRTMVRCGDTMHCLAHMGTNYGTLCRYNALSGGHGNELWYVVAIQCIVWWTWVGTIIRCGNTMRCLVDMGTNYGTVWRYNALSGGHGYELWYGFAIKCIVWWTWVRIMVRFGDTMHCLVDIGTNVGTVWRYNALSGGYMTNYGTVWRYNVLSGGHGYELWYGLVIQCIVW